MQTADTYVHPAWDSHLRGLQYRQTLRTDDILAMAFIRPLLDGGPFLPFTNSSFRPFNLACILNDIVINKRARLLEFGSGISTILIGRLIERNHLASEIFSVEHDAAWKDVVQEYVDAEQLGGRVHLIHAPLQPSQAALEDNAWYDLQALDAHGLSAMQFDMVIIDGPPAWQAGKQKARYPALPFVIDRLGQDAVVYLDDAHRAGERAILKRWEDDHPVKFCFTGGTLAYFKRGQGYNPVIG